MKKKFLAILAFLTLANGAIAAPFQVQSGEHDGYSRIVATIPLNAEWSVEQSGTIVSLKVPEHTEGFDVDAVFQFIPRARIGKVSSARDELTLDLECRCNVSAFLVREQFVVIDVASPNTVLATPLITSKQTGRGPLTSPRPKSVRAERTERPSVALPLIPVRTIEPTRPVGKASPRPTDLLALPEPSALSNRILNQVQLDLARELGEATSRGTLQRVPGAVLHPSGPEVPQVREENPPLAIEPTRQSLAPGQNIRISDSMDIPQNNQRERDRRTTTDRNCPAPELFEVEEWGDDSTFAAQIGKARETLFGEFDRLVPESARGLAETYLYFGFGAEARQVIALDPNMVRGNPFLNGMGEVLEYGSARDTSLLHELIECDSAAALWAAMASDNIPRNVWVNSDAALLALNKLPVHLRQIIAPGFSRRMLDYGDPETASVALRSLQRLPLALQPDAALAQAEVSLIEGETDAGQAQLGTVIDADSDPSPKALIALVNSKLRHGQPISVEVATLLEAFAQELRNEPLGPDLRQAHVLALAKSGQFDRGFAALDALAGKDANETATKLRLQLIDELTNAASDIVFLEFAFAQTMDDLAQLTEPGKMAIVDRFLSLGFAGIGQQILATLPEHPLKEGRQMLAAKLALALGQPLKAQAVLVGFEGIEADRLRADAKRMAGQNDDAHALYARTDDSDAAEETAWLSEDWRELTPEDTPVLGAMSALPGPEPFDPAERTGMLAKTSAALTESATAREVISSLLTAPLLAVPTLE